MHDRSFSNYIDLDRWNSYYYQIKETLQLHPKSVLEVGIGSKIAYTVLSLFVPTTGLDSDESLKPDIVADIRNFKSKKKYDLVLCAEVLEHMPFKDIERSIKNIYNVTRLGAVITLPYAGPSFRFSLRIPRIGQRSCTFKIPIYLPFRARVSQHKEHLWEIGREEITPDTIKKLFNQHGLEVIKDYIVPQNPFHYLFVLKKY